MRSILLLFVLPVVAWAPGALAQAPDPGYGGRSGANLTQPGKDAPSPVPPAKPAPPVLLADPGADYPRKAIEEGVREPALVELVVEVDANGDVRTASVESSAGHGFDEAAVAAALRLKFKPATRADVPIPSRIRHRYVFTPPPGQLVGRVLTERNRPIAGATVRARAEKDVRETTTAQDGSFAFAGVPSGTWTIEVSAPGYGPESAAEELGPAQEVSSVLRLQGVAAGPSKGSDADAGELEEVRVRGQRPPREVTKRTLDQRELLRIPGSNGDALRALQNLPGVARPPGFAGLLVVRGSAPQDTNVFIDGTLIPLVYHFGGLSSVVPTEMLSKIDFYPGNFGASYGRAMGGIVDVGVRDPKKDKLHGLAQVDLVDARVLAEGPVPWLGKKGWTFAVAGRRSYIDVWLKPVLEAAGASVSTAPVYYDWQAIVNKQFDKHTNFRLMFFGSDDRIELLVKNVSTSAPAVGGDLSAHTAFWRLQGRFESKLGKTTDLKVTAAVGQDVIDFSFSEIFFRLNSWPITLRTELSEKVSKGIVANVGLDLLYAPAEVSIRAPPALRPGEPPPGPLFLRAPRSLADKDQLYRPATYFELELTPWTGTRIVPGVRLDYAKDTKAFDLSPRVVVRQDIGPRTPRTTIKGGIGVYAQPPLPQQSNAVFGQLGLSSNRALHYSIGVERELNKNIELSVEGFYKQLDNLVVSSRGNTGKGKVVGLEVLLRYKPDKHFFGWVAYTLSKSTRTDVDYEPEHPAAFDQTHIFTVLGSYRLGAGWELGARFRLVSGNPYTANAYGFFDANAGTFMPISQVPVLSQRMPLFHQLDLRLDKTWKFKAWQLGAYADILNVYNAANVEAIQYNYNFTRQTYVTGLPILPSFGLRGEM